MNNVLREKSFNLHLLTTVLNGNAITTRKMPIKCPWCTLREVQYTLIILVVYFFGVKFQALDNQD